MSQVLSLAFTRTIEYLWLKIIAKYIRMIAELSCAVTVTKLPHTLQISLYLVVNKIML